MRRLARLMIILLLVVACGSAEEAVGELLPYSSPNYPLTIMIPEDWAVTDNEDSITIASSEALLSGNSVEDGARINITVSPSFFSGSDNAREVIEAAVRSIREQEEAEVIQEIHNVAINSQLGLETVVRGRDAQDTEVILRYVVIENPSVLQSAVVVAVHDANENGRYGQLMNDIVNSIQLGDTSNQ